jgi:hypothetical protein
MTVYTYEDVTTLGILYSLNAMNTDLKLFHMKF